MPLNDNERYEKMSSSVPKGTGPEYTQEGYPLAENSWMFLYLQVQSAQYPIQILHPGPWLRRFLQHCIYSCLWLWSDGHGEDSPGRRGNLLINYDWAQKAYDGEDKNRNNILDEGEIIMIIRSSTVIYFQLLHQLLICMLRLKQA